MNKLPPHGKALSAKNDSGDDVIEVHADRGIEKSNTIKMSRQRLGASSRIISAPSPNTSTPVLKHNSRTLTKTKHPSSRYLFSPLRTIIKPPETPSSSWSMDSALEKYEGNLLVSGQKSLSNEFALLSFDDVTVTPGSVERQNIDMLYGDSKPGAKLSVVPETHDLEHSDKFGAQTSGIDHNGEKEANHLKSSFAIKLCLEDEFISENEQDTTFEDFDTHYNSSTTEIHSSQSMIHLFEQDSFELYKEISSEVFFEREDNQNHQDQLRPNNVKYQSNTDMATQIPRTKLSIDYHSKIDEYKRIGENASEIFREKALVEENDDTIPLITRMNSTEYSENTLFYLSSSDDEASSKSFYNQTDSRITELYDHHVLLNPNEKIFFRPDERDEQESNALSSCVLPSKVKLLQLGNNDDKIPQIFRKRGYTTSGEVATSTKSNKFNIYTDIMHHVNSKMDDKRNKKPIIHEDPSSVNTIPVNKSKKIQPSVFVKAVDTTTPSRIPLSRISLTSPNMNNRSTLSAHKSARKKITSKASSKTEKTTDNTPHLSNINIFSLKENI